jgi:hypothetical protein
MRQGVYKTLKHMEADFILMTDNAKRYNAPKSVIYKDACKLKLLAKETSKKLSSSSNDYGDATHVAKRAKLVDELVDLTQIEFNKKLLEAEAEAEAAAATVETAATATSTSKTKKGYFSLILI